MGGSAAPHRALGEKHGTLRHYAAAIQGCAPGEWPPSSRRIAAGARLPATGPAAKAHSALSFAPLPGKVRAAPDGPALPKGQAAVLTEDFPACRLCTPRRAAASAALLLGAVVLAGCGASNGSGGASGGADRVLFLATTGEAPGARTPFTGYAGRERLARLAPALTLRRARPANVPPDPYAPPGSPGQALPTAPTDPTAEPKTPRPRIQRSRAGTRLNRLRELYIGVRQRFSDRDDEVQFQQRVLRLNVRDHKQARRPLLIRPGDPLPSNDPEFRTSVKTFRDSIARIRGTLVRLNGVLLRLDENLRAGAVILRALQRAREWRGDEPKDRTLHEALVKAMQTSLGRAAGLRRNAGALLGNYIEWLISQEQGVDELVRQVTGASGSNGSIQTLKQILTRKTLIK